MAAMLFAVSSCVLALPAWSADDDYALMLPGASTSLLLDIDRAGQRLVEVGERGNILYSDDQGKTWVQAMVPTSVMLTRVFFVNDRLGWAVGHDGNILVSEDSGEHWELQRHGPTDQERINEDNVVRADQRLKALRARLGGADSSDAEPLQADLEDAERALESAREVQRDPVFPPPLMDVWFSDEERGWAAGAFGTLLHTSNGGRLWEDWSYKLPNPDELHLNGVAGDAAGTLFLASEWGDVFRSTSGGETWELVETGYDGSFFGLLLNPATGSVFAYGLLGTVYRSSDQGQSWQELDSRTRASLFGAASDARGTLVFTGEEGTAVRSDDDGAHFSVLHTGTKNGLYGVTATTDGAFVATGQGGSVALPGVRGGAR